MNIKVNRLDMRDVTQREGLSGDRLFIILVTNLSRVISSLSLIISDVPRQVASGEFLGNDGTILGRKSTVCVNKYSWDSICLNDRLIYK